MKSKNSQIIIITSILCLLPIIMSIAVYSNLPEQIAIHWDSAGNPDNYLPKAVVAFGIPILFVLINIYSKIRLFNDPKGANASSSARMLSVWLIPVAALAGVPITLFIALGISIPISVIAPIFMGIVLIAFGNYLPKSRQNYTIGIKLPWTLHDADNWNKTHRVAGYLYIVGGLALIALTFIFFKSAFLGVVTIAIIILLLVLPVLYSYLLYRKSGGKEEG